MLSLLMYWLGTTKEPTISVADIIPLAPDYRNASFIEIHTTDQQSSVKQNESECFVGYGTVTRVLKTHVIIENRYMCETECIGPARLERGDKVRYVAYKTKIGEKLRIRKIIDKIKPSRQQQCIPVDKTYPILKKSDNLLITELNNCKVNPTEKHIRQIREGVEIGKVDKRIGRDVYLHDGTIINLDRSTSNFVPAIGDWLKIKCLVEVNEGIPNLKNKILKVESIQPVKFITKLGKVAEYNEVTEYGIVDESIFFYKCACVDGFRPYRGDRVIVQSIQNDQIPKMKWRALSVSPLKDVSSKYGLATVKQETLLPLGQNNDLLEDKRNIEITKDIKINLNVDEEQVIEIKVKNNGNFIQKIRKRPFSVKKVSQISLIAPETEDPILLNPEEEITYTFKCTARFVGLSQEVVIFTFKDFKIGRIFEIKINNNNFSDPTQEKKKYDSCINERQSKSIIPKPYREGTYIRGVKPFKPPKFILVRNCRYEIPHILWSTVDLIIQEKKNRIESELALQKVVPHLKETLNFENYELRFQHLLYLEEIADILNMQKYEMNCAVMKKNGEFLTLTVPGLAEKRPSLIVGDRIVVTYNWEKDAKNYESYIHKIINTDVYLKFNPIFHESYKSEECTVRFATSSTVIHRRQAAISMVVPNLGPDVLFPKRVVQKEPQINFVEEEDGGIEQVTLSRMMNKEDHGILKKLIHWFNKKLNTYQKEAVKNILKGLARPLPYVIFGPPGTGKTITMVETILQVYLNIRDSRIIIATPSNSSANLIAEKLLDSKALLNNDLVRLVAYYYLENDRIPTRLIPYCMTADIAEEGTRSGHTYEANQKGCQKNVSLQTLCRHRIIVGTCSAFGSLYNMGCKPGYFTHIFVDEAGQASEPEIMIPLSLAHKNSSQVVLAGDPKQLGPVNQSWLAGYFGLNNSFLVRLLQQFPYQKDPEGFETGYDPRLITKLLMNYRSLPDLLSLPNELFYESELIAQVHPVDSDEAELLHGLVDLVPKRIGDPPSIVFHCAKGQNMQDKESTSWYNVEEAIQIHMYLLMLYNNGLKSSDIGIITPYSKQVYFIKNRLIQHEIDLPKIGTVEEFQGQERKVVLLSTVRTSEEKVRTDVRHSLGFVAARERLNVAITRARVLLIIIGHLELLEQDYYWRSVITHCKARNSVTGHNFK
ncbi:probable RNA helicase armi [Copidosoma floridanum]|uniref:probable RNA helicase armi n=1 Tax=Copidosoma floridanum TaxID=29053 RepID=UPI0006C98AF1|nr:probable RNA helicase armi [Copidosoma floridanum]